MKQLLSITIFDIKMNFKSFMGGYMLIVPIAILLVLRSFIPAMDEASTTIGVVTSGKMAVDSSLVIELGRYANIIECESLDELKNRLRGAGSMEGLYFDPDKNQLVSLLEQNIENNTLFSSGATIVRQIFQKSAKGYQIEYNAYIPKALMDRTEKSPVSTLGGGIYIVFMALIGGFIIGLRIVTDKEEGVDRALRVSPLKTSEYILGKSILVLLFSAFYTILCLLLLDLTHANIGQTFSVVISSMSSTLLMGLVLGAIARNETEAIGLGKMLSMLIGLSIIGGTLLPEGIRFIVYWSPFYWIMDALEGIFTNSTNWFEVGYKSLLIIILSAGFFLLLRKKIVKGLS